jgi:hypothetical protein
MTTERQQDQLTAEQIGQARLDAANRAERRGKPLAAVAAMIEGARSIAYAADTLQAPPRCAMRDAGADLIEAADAVRDLIQAALDFRDCLTAHAWNACPAARRAELVARYAPQEGMRPMRAAETRFNAALAAVGAPL